MKRLLISLPFILLLNLLKAQVSISAGKTITETFDNMDASAIAMLPLGWRADMQPNQNARCGIYSQTNINTTKSGSVNITSDAGSGIYNFGSSSTTSDRCIGGLTGSSTPKTINIYLELINNGTTDIESFIISFDIEKYKRGTNKAGSKMVLSYSFDGSTWFPAETPDFQTIIPGDTSNNGYSIAPGETKSVNSQILIHRVVPDKHFYLAWSCTVASGSTTTNAQALGVDNVVITAVGDASAPLLIPSTPKGFDDVCVSTTISRSFILKGNNLDGTPITIGHLDNYTFSTSSTGNFTDTLKLPYSGSNVDATIYVRFTPTEVKSYNGNISISGGGATSITIPVTGAGVNIPPSVSTGSSGDITTSTATLAGTITDVGCSSITTYGIEYSTTNNFTNGSGKKSTSKNLANSIFTSIISNLSPGTKYYYHAYATNGSGTSYGNQQSFTTDTVATSPIDTTHIDLTITALPATDTTTTSFTAKWTSVKDATRYYLDVSTTNDFIDNPTQTTIANWTFPDTSADAIVDAASIVNATQTISTKGETKDPTFDVTGATNKAARATGWNSGKDKKCWQLEINTTSYQNIQLSSKQRSSSTGPKNFKVQYQIGAIGEWKDISTATVTVADNFISGVLTNKNLPAECNNQSKVLLRWIMTSDSSVNNGTVSSSGASLIDDILITGNQTTYVPGYKNITVTDTSLSITGLSPNITYYYRVRAANEDTASLSSNIISVVTLAAPKEEIELEAIALPATDIIPNSFIAHWMLVEGATSYHLDVSTKTDFSGGYITGYENLQVNDTFKLITGLSPNTTYYYRVRVSDENTTSPHSNVIIVITTKEDVPLPPTTLSSFSGLWQSDKNTIRWTTATENNNDGFDLQRSSDSIHFQSIGYTSSYAPGGNSSSPLDYAFDDYAREEEDTLFYRLKVADLDGTFYHSDVIAVRGVKKIATISIDGLYPNPAAGTINLRISTPVQANVACSIIDSRGHIVKQIPLHLESGSNIFPIDITGVPPGTYHLQCIFQGFVDTRKFVVR